MTNILTTPEDNAREDARTAATRRAGEVIAKALAEAGYDVFEGRAHDGKLYGVTLTSEPEIEMSVWVSVTE